MVITDNYIKPCPICRWTRAVLDAPGLVVQRHSLTEKDIAKVKVHTFAQAAALFSGMPKNTSEAQYFLPFALAVRLVHGHIAPQHITAKGLADPRIRQALNKIEVSEDSSHSKRFPVGRWSDVTVYAHNGTGFHSGHIHARGGPEPPMPPGETEARFHTIEASLTEKRRTAIRQTQSRLPDPDVLFSELLFMIFAPVDTPDV